MKIKKEYWFTSVNGRLTRAEEKTVMKKIEQNEGCQHDLKEYIGFTDRYNYCTKCGEKEKT